MKGQGRVVQYYIGACHFSIFEAAVVMTMQYSKMHYSGEMLKIMMDIFRPWRGRRPQCVWSWRRSGCSGLQMASASRLHFHADHWKPRSQLQTQTDTDRQSYEHAITYTCTCRVEITHFCSSRSVSHRCSWNYWSAWGDMQYYILYIVTLHTTDYIHTPHHSLHTPHYSLHTLLTTHYTHHTHTTPLTTHTHHSLHTHHGGPGHSLTEVSTKELGVDHSHLPPLAVRIAHL